MQHEREGGFALSLAAIVPPPGAHLIGRHPGTDGPQIVRQVTLLQRLAANSADATGDRRARGADHRRFFALWQANVVRKPGAIGWLFAVLGTGALVAAFVIVVRRLFAGLSSN